MPARPYYLIAAALLACAALASVPAATAAGQDARAEIGHDQEDGGGGSTLPPDLLQPTNDHGCQVLLCLASPGGPMEFAECVPPIQKLYRDLARGRSFPSCAMGGGEGGNNARQRGDFIDVFIDGKLYQTIRWRGGSTGDPGGGGRDQDLPPQQIH